ncbi:MFS general substrate transporter [Thozetella sp. PMI_491]|nr:MFS general substrate transporter [Thozetella sp. PMI_491]
MQAGTAQRRGFDASRAERCAYYLYFAANNGVGPYLYCAFLFQNLIYQAGFNPDVLPLGSEPCGDPSVPCHVYWAGGTKPYASVVLIASGITFAGQAVLFILLGATADYGNWAPWILRIAASLYGSLSFVYLGVKTPGVWGGAMALYIVINIAFWTVFTFFVALFPKITESHARARKALEEKDSGTVSEVEYKVALQIIRSRVMNHAWGWNNLGYALTGCLCLAILIGLRADDSTEQNNLGYSVCVAMTGGVALIFSLPWFVLQQPRPGKPVPRGHNIVTIGLANYWSTFVNLRKLSQAFFYLVLYFFLNDGANTLLTEVLVLQSSVVLFSAVSNTYYVIVQGFSAFIFPFVAIAVQEVLGTSTKRMLHLTNFVCVLVSLWGMVGIWTTNFGFHQAWEFWAFSATMGLSVGCQWSYSQAFMAQLVPQGDENQFFSLLGVVSKGGGWIGPVVSSALIDRTGNINMPFAFITPLITIPAILLIFVDEDRAQIDSEKYVAERRGERAEPGVDNMASK